MLLGSSFRCSVVASAGGRLSSSGVLFSTRIGECGVLLGSWISGISSQSAGGRVHAPGAHGRRKAKGNPSAGSSSPCYWKGSAMGEKRGKHTLLTAPLTSRPSSPAAHSGLHSLHRTIIGQKDYDASTSNTEEKHLSRQLITCGLQSRYTKQNNPKKTNTSAPHITPQRPRGSTIYINIVH